MGNNVVRGVADGLARRGLLTLRFDYRGVGLSQGPSIDVARHLAEFWRTSHVPDEMDYWRDVQGAVDFLHGEAPGLPMALVGYSFGCALLPSVRSPDGFAALALVAPTVGKHDYHAYQAINTPLLVVASQDDFATDVNRLEAWFTGLSMPRKMLREKLDNHFFRGHEDCLAEAVFDFLANAGDERP